MTEITPKQIIDTSLEAVDKFTGNVTQLETAIGALVVGKRVGWKVLYLIHDKKTLQRYEEILDLKFREILPEVGPKASKSVAWAALEGIKNFWKAVKGEITGIRSPMMDEG